MANPNPNPNLNPNPNPTPNPNPNPNPITLTTSLTRYETEWVEAVAATSADECCTKVKAASSPLNPIEAWQFEEARGENAPTCVFLKRKFYQSKSLEAVQPAGMFAKRSCVRTLGHPDVFTYYRNLELPGCTTFELLISNVLLAPGVDLPKERPLGEPPLPTATAAPRVFYRIDADGVEIAANAADVPATSVAKGYTASECCSECRFDVGCHAWQHTGGACVKVDGRLLLAKPDVAALDMNAWAHTRGEGLLYTREPQERAAPAPVSLSPSAPPPHGRRAVARGHAPPSTRLPPEARLCWPVTLPLAPRASTAPIRSYGTKSAAWMAAARSHHATPAPTTRS